MVLVLMKAILQGGYHPLTPTAVTSLAWKRAKLAAIQILALIFILPFRKFYLQPRCLDRVAHWCSDSHLMLRHGLLSSNSKLLPQNQGKISISTSTVDGRPGSTMSLVSQGEHLLLSSLSLFFPPSCHTFPPFVCVVVGIVD